SRPTRGSRCRRSPTRTARARSPASTTSRAAPRAPPSTARTTPTGKLWAAAGCRLPAAGSQLNLIKYLKARLEPILVSDREFVDEAFRDILGREPDPGGLAFSRGVLRRGVRRTAVLLDIMRSEEFRRSLAPPAPSSLPNLVLQRPERYRRAVDRNSHQSILVFDAATPSDFDWLESAIITNGYHRAAA